MKTLHKMSSLAFIIMLIAAVALSACSNNTNNGAGSTTNEGSGPATNDVQKDEPKEEVTIEFWHTYGEDLDKGTGERPHFVKEVIPAFEKAYPYIKIKEVSMPTENLQQQVLTAAAGGAVPDVMRMDLTWVGEFAKLKAIKALDDYPGFKEIAASVFPGTLSTNVYRGKHYGLPLNTNTKVGIYNKELLTEAGASVPPKTMDELVNLARSLKAKGKFGITIGGTNTWDFLPWFWSLGGKITNDEFTKASGFLDSPESIKALETVVSWNDEGLVAPTITGGNPTTWDGLQGKDGATATYMMINDGPWFYSIFGDSVKETMIPAKMPSGPNGQGHSIVGGENLVMFEGAKHPDEAWLFMQFMLSVETQVKMAGVGLIPTNVEAAKSEELKNVYYLPAYVAELETAYPRTPSAQWSKISDRLGLAFETIVKKQTSAKDELSKAAAEIDSLLAD